MKQYKVDIVTVATNIYIDYWKQMVNSIEKSWASGEKEFEITAHVFTDSPLNLKADKKEHSSVRICEHPIENLVWPEATLNRYQLIHSIENHLEGDVLMHLDADMLVVKDIWNEVVEGLSQEEVILVRHPGYWRPGKFNRAILWFSARIMRILKPNADPCGSWETRKVSKAYVPRHLRRNYYCGGIWFGARNPVLQLVRFCSNNVTSDKNNNVTAIWHDESHLNKWATENPLIFREKDPSFCFVDEYRYLSKLDPKVVAVTKTTRTR